MDASTIQEIANQLGLAVDQIQQMIPMYAGMKVAAYTFGLIVCTVIFFITCPTGIYCFKCMKIYNESGKDSTWYSVGSFVFFAAALIVLVFMVVAAYHVYMWKCFPDATFYQMLFDSVRRAK